MTGVSRLVSPNPDSRPASFCRALYVMILHKSQDRGQRREEEAPRSQESEKLVKQQVRRNRESTAGRKGTTTGEEGQGGRGRGRRGKARQGNPLKNHHQLLEMEES